MGAFLELGSEGNLGAYHVAGVPFIYTYEVVQARQCRIFVLFTYICFCMSADVLVGHQFPAFCC